MSNLDQTQEGRPIADEDDGQETSWAVNPATWQSLWDEISEEWRAFGPARRVRQTLNFDILGTTELRQLRINRAVVVALGSTFEIIEVKFENGEEEIGHLPHNSMCQLIALEEWLKVFQEGGRGMTEVHFYDPRFLQEDLDLLTGRGYRATKGLVPNNVITNKVVVFALYLPQPSLLRMLRNTRPGLLISNNLRDIMRHVRSEADRAILSDFLNRYECWTMPEDLNKICRDQDTAEGLSWLYKLSIYFPKSASRLEEQQIASLQARSDNIQRTSKEPAAGSSVFDTTDKILEPSGA